MKNFIKNSDLTAMTSRYFAVLVALIIFIPIVFLDIPFYKAIALMLEFIVVIEVVRMIIDFINSHIIKLRFVIDLFIVFLTRDVIIQITQPTIDQERILFLLFVIFTFFIFRLMTLYLGPTAILKDNKDNEI